MMLMILSSTHEIARGLLSIAVFGVGSIVGMVVIGIALSLPLVCSLTISRRLFVALLGFASAASLSVGVWMLLKLAAP